MSDKPWDELKGPEKIENLRSDVVRIYRLLSAVASDTRTASIMSRENQMKLSEVAKAVEKLEDQFPKAKK
jgi:hypothetical protein